VFVTAVNDEFLHSAKLLIRQNVLFGVFCLGDRDIVYNVAFILAIVRGVDSDVFGVDEVVFSIDADFKGVTIGRCSVAHSVIDFFHIFKIAEVWEKSSDFFDLYDLAVSRKIHLQGFFNLMGNPSDAIGGNLQRNGQRV